LAGDHDIYFGDLHNHNAVGYAKGSLQRSFDIAREHLDFFAFTGHSQWHDMPIMPADKHMVWVKGFEAHQAGWAQVQKLTRESYQAGRFVTFPGYEWHSSVYGDYCVLFPTDDSELFTTSSVGALAEQVKPFGALMFPHHVAYAQGWRGVDWEQFPAEMCPVCEVFSEHGATMYDRGLHPMLRHSNGGRSTRNTVHHALAMGYRFGLIGGTDDHFGYPGAWGEGLAAVWADELSREGIWEALNSRRCYAVTGDRIVLEFSVNGLPMGAEMDYEATRELAVCIEAMDEIGAVEVLKNGRVVHREFVPTVLPEDTFQGGRAKLRIVWGWGPWSSLEMARTCQWEGSIGIAGGTLLKATPIFQSGPYEEDLRDKLDEVGASGLRFSSYTSRRDAFAENPTKGVILEIEGTPETKVSLAGKQPARFGCERTLGELMAASEIVFTGPFTSESVLMERLVVPASYRLRFTWTDRGEGGEADYYMIRVTQSNGQMAWSSPVWVNAPR